MAFVSQIASSLPSSSQQTFFSACSPRLCNSSDRQKYSRRSSRAHATVCSINESSSDSTAKLQERSIEFKPLSTGEPRKDSWFDELFISLFRKAIAPEVQWESPIAGFAGMVQETRVLRIQKSAKEQRAAVLRVLNRLMCAPFGTWAFRTFVRPLKNAPWLNAWLTTKAFTWLVGPCELNDGEEGAPGVFIEKCRFLDESGCKAMCVNLCKVPTTTFFNETLGIPLRMTPNYETKSCQMSFGVHSLPLDSDPALQPGCLAGCSVRGWYGDRQVGSELLWTAQQPPTHLPSASTSGSDLDADLKPGRPAVGAVTCASPRPLDAHRSEPESERRTESTEDEASEAQAMLARGLVRELAGEGSTAPGPLAK